MFFGARVTPCYWDRMYRCFGVLAFLALQFVSGCAYWSRPLSVGPGSVPIAVPPGVDLLRVQRAVVRADELVRSFAATNGWSNEAEIRTFDSVEVFANQEDLWRRILQINKMPPDTPLRVRGLTAALEGRVLLAVSPDEYARVAPDYAARPESWPRLMAHEVVHRLHVEILKGDEAAMGPQWFFEGFAVFGSGQDLDEGLVYRTADEALQGVHDTSSPQAYRRFVAAVRYFARLVPLPDLVRRAQSADFESWLRAQEGPR